MERDSFIFYRSWLEAILNLPRDLQGDVLLAITRYAILGDASADGLKPIARAMLAMAKPQIDANNQRYANGCNGGRRNQRPTESEPDNNRKQTEVEPKSNRKITEVEPKANQRPTESEPNEYVYENENVYDNDCKETPLTGSKEKPAPADFSSQASVDNSRKDAAADAAGLYGDPSNPPCPAGEETPPPGSAPPPSPRIDYIAIMNDFNARFAGRLPGVSRMTDSRRAAVKARIAECGPDSVTAVFDAIAASPFLCGANDRNWRADFDWVFKPRNYVKILENNYKNLKTDGQKSKRRFGDHDPADYVGKGITDI